MDRLKRLLGNGAGRNFINEIKNISAQKKQVIEDEKATETFIVLIDKWSYTRRNSLEEKKCIEEIVNLCFEAPTAEKRRKVKDVCIIDASKTIFWKVICVYILIPNNYELKEILGEVISASEITVQDWEKALNESENITLIINKK